MDSNYSIRYVSKAFEPEPVNTQTSSWRKLNLIILTLYLLSFFENSRAAGTNDSIKAYAASNMLFDSNFFRIADSANSSASAGQSDRSEFIKQIAAGLKLNWKINRQQLLAEASLNQNWFHNFSSLDYLGWGSSAQWNWNLGNHINGEIGYGNKVFLGDYSQLNRFVPNLHEDRQFFANAGYMFHARGLLKLGWFRKERQFDDPTRQISNTLEDNAEVTLQYISPTKSHIGIHTVLTRGQFPNRDFDAASTLDDGYQRFNSGLVWDWHYSAITHIDGMVGYLQQHYNHLSTRDFGDAIANLALHWQATEKTLIDLLFKREIRQANNLNASFSLVQGIEFKTQFEISPKLKLSLPINYFNQQFLGNIGSENTTLTPERDNSYGLGLNLIYQPLDNISINTMLHFEKRDSNYSNRAYQSQAAGLSVQAVF